LGRLQKLTKQNQKFLHVHKKHHTQAIEYATPTAVEFFPFGSTEPQMPPNFQILFFGEILTGHNHVQVRTRLQDLLRCSDEALAVVFSGERIVLRKGLDATSAERYLQKLMKMGLAVRVDPPLMALPEAPETAPAEFRPPPGISLPPLSQMPPTSDFPPLGEAAPVAEIHASPPTEIPGVLSPEEHLAIPARTGRPVPPPPCTETASRDVVSCPRCGEVQPRQPICRVCQTDMARFTEARKAQALKLAEDHKGRNKRQTATTRIIYRDDGSGVIGLDFNGRIGRRGYALAGLWTLNLVLLGIWSSLISSQLLPLLLCMLLAGLYGVRVTVLRLHDLGWKGSWMLLGLVPVLNLLQSLWLGLGPGESSANRWGKPSRPMHPGEFAIGLLLALGCMGGLGYRLASEWAQLPIQPSETLRQHLQEHFPAVQGFYMPHLPGRPATRLPA
jgi:uncharacterized membrane protein YhaH (DUF805 family)